MSTTEAPRTWKVYKTGNRFSVIGPEETYDFADKRRAMQVATDRAHGSMTVETARKLQALDNRQFGARR